MSSANASKLDWSRNLLFANGLKIEITHLKGFVYGSAMANTLMYSSSTKLAYILGHLTIPKISRCLIFGIKYLTDMPILGSSSSAANKDMMSTILTNGNIIFWLSRKPCGKKRNCSLRATSSFPTMFSKAVCCWCVKMSIYGGKG